MASVRELFRKAAPSAGEYPFVRRRLSALRSGLEGCGIEARDLSDASSGLTRSERKRMERCYQIAFQARDEMLHVMSTVAERLGDGR